MASTAVTYPLDVVRGRITVQNAHTAQYTGILDCMRKVVQAEGPKGLYRGIAPTITGMFPYIGVNFSTFNTLKAKVMEVTGKDKLDTFPALASGAVAGLAGQTAAYPFDFLRRRAQMAGFAKGAQYDGMLATARAVIAKEGFLALYSGIMPNYVKAVPLSATQFAAYNFITQHLGLT